LEAVKFFHASHLLFLLLHPVLSHEHFALFACDVVHLMPHLHKSLTRLALSSPCSALFFVVMELFKRDWLLTIATRLWFHVTVCFMLSELGLDGFKGAILAL
jgi:hypothetical protein